MAQEATIFDRELLRRRRTRAAPGAEAHDFLLTRIADDFAERLSIVKRDFPLVLDVGASHGLLGRRLRQLDSVGQVVEMEATPALLARCEGPRVLADEEAIPFADGTFDLAVSGLALQHVNDLPGTLVQIRRALKPDGLFLGALLGGETLRELRHAMLLAEDEVEGGASPRVAPFADVRELGGLLQRAGFALPVADSDVVEVRYASALALMRDIKAMGASNALLARRRKPMSRALLARAAAIYADLYAAPGGRVRATFEIVTLTAWVPHESQQKPLRPGSATMRLAEALGTTEIGAGDTAPLAPKPARGGNDGA
jgi:SAM-dependent methyltransferase